MPVHPVQNVLFLTNRSYQESAVLVTTEAGKIEFWPVFGVTRPSGKNLGDLIIRLGMNGCYMAREYTFEV